MNIKRIVFEYIHVHEGMVNYDELTECVFSFKPKSAWSITHWNYYRSQITSANGRFYSEFSEAERSNLKKKSLKVAQSDSAMPRPSFSYLKKLNENTMIKKITRPASLVKQGALSLYATSLKVSDLLLHNFYSVETLDPDDHSDKGYQRLLNKARAKKLADYIVAGQDTKDAFLPTSIFMATHKNIDFNTVNNTIEIDIDEIGPFSVVDGQHRVEGLKMAAEKDARVLDFEVPVNIAINLSKIAQMCHFLIVNTTQKSVEKGVEQRIYARLTNALEVEDIPNLPKWISNSVQKGEDERALQFVDYLNKENESPWFNRIEMANEDNKDATVNQKSFVKL